MVGGEGRPAFRFLSMSLLRRRCRTLILTPAPRTPSFSIFPVEDAILKPKLLESLAGQVSPSDGRRCRCRCGKDRDAITGAESILSWFTSKQVTEEKETGTNYRF